MNLSFDVPLGGSLAASCCFLEHLRTPIGVSWGHHGSLLSRLRASFEAFPDVQDAHRDYAKRICFHKVHKAMLASGGYPDRPLGDVLGHWQAF